MPSKPAIRLVHIGQVGDCAPASYWSALGPSKEDCAEPKEEARSNYDQRKHAYEEDSHCCSKGQVLGRQDLCCNEVSDHQAFRAAKDCWNDIIAGCKDECKKQTAEDARHCERQGHVEEGSCWSRTKIHA